MERHDRCPLTRRVSELAVAAAGAYHDEPGSLQSAHNLVA